MNKFLKMITALRTKEEVMLYGNLPETQPGEEATVIEFLRKEYLAEADDYPYEVPPFSDAAALWAAKTIYTAAQLMLYRQNKGADIPALLRDYGQEQDAAAVLSADICLRFLPDMLRHLRVIDPDDPLTDRLEDLLYKWHFSAVNYDLNTENLNMHNIASNLCLRQLYANRIIEYKKAKLAVHPVFAGIIAGNISIFEKELWTDLKIK